MGMNLNEIMEFDHVVEVHSDGTVTDGPVDVFAPELFDEEVSPGWTLLNGWSGQDRYPGPIMHASEYIGGRMAAWILENPGVYVALVSYDLDDLDGEPFGWAVAKLDD